jgi:TetR/AcrR family transcriptional regulator, transcriptional repressor for nem operon
VEGPEGISIAAIMARAGLTHGGFYAHFGSKEELIAAAIQRMFEMVDRATQRRLEGLEPAEALAYFIDDYLSARHVDSVSEGCPLPAVSADVARLGTDIKAPFSHGFVQLQEHLADRFRQLGHQNTEAEELATSVYAEMVGALSLARAIQDPDQAAKIRNHCRRSVKRRLGLNLALRNGEQGAVRLAAGIYLFQQLRRSIDVRRVRASAILPAHSRPKRTQIPTGAGR